MILFRPFLRHWILRLAWSVALIAATVVIGGAVDARRRLPDLQPWHRIVPTDWRASDSDTATLADYLQREDTVFREVHDFVRWARA